MTAADIECLEKLRAALAKVARREGRCGLTKETHLEVIALGCDIEREIQDAEELAELI
jgi:hypothetical protein